MSNKHKTRNQLSRELAQHRRRIVRLKKSVTASKRQAEESLRESEKRLRFLVQSIPDIIMTVACDGRILAINRTVRGFSVEETIGRKVYDYVEPGHRDVMRRTLKRAFKTGRPGAYMILAAGPEGPNTAWYETRVLPIRRDKQVAAVTLVSTDITVRKKAEEALKESEEKYRTLTENINVGVYRNTPGPKGRFIEANPAFLEMFAYKNKEQVFTINVADLYQHPRDRKAFNEKMLKNGFVRNEELQLRKKDGFPIICSVSAVAIKDEKGNTRYYDGIIENITDRKRAEEELKRLATVDPLTGLLNRGSGLLLLSKYIQLAKRQDVRLSVCYLDVNGLKQINDMHGHQRGDDALKLIGKLLRDTIRKSDAACRLGGDEFLVIFPQCAVDQASAIWRRMAKKVAAFNNKKRTPYNISLSYGFAEYSSGRSKTIEQLLAIADHEMYKQKHAKFEK